MLECTQPLGVVELKMNQIPDLMQLWISNFFSHCVTLHALYVKRCKHG